MKNAYLPVLELQPKELGFSFGTFLEAIEVLSGNTDQWMPFCALTHDSSPVSPRKNLGTLV